MLGLLISKVEQQELVYIIKKELDEILFDLQEESLEHLIERAMEERYKIVFNLFRRVATEEEYLPYIRQDNKKK